MTSRQEKIRNRISKVNQLIQNNYSKKTEYARVEKKIDKVIEYLNDAIDDFKKGGHVIPGTEFASEEFSHTLDQVDIAKRRLINVQNHCALVQRDLWEEKQDLQKSL